MQLNNLWLEIKYPFFLYIFLRELSLSMLVIPIGQTIYGLYFSPYLKKHAWKQNSKKMGTIWENIK